ncbi:hypothetical protein [Streptomyces lasiicapitis]|uniref:hypothetical protein n=1 Tax=Streptomyces lasiicapitis TaxID=1923961 RepID=UPI003695F95C
MSTPSTSRAPVGLEEAAHLKSLAERIHTVADDLPAPQSAYSLASTGEEVEDQLRAISAIFASIAGEAAFHGRAARRYPEPEGALARRKIALMTRAAEPLGWALAKLGEAVAQIGRLHEVRARPRTPERAEAVRTAHAALDDQLTAAHLHLCTAAGNLHLDANQLTTPPPSSGRSPALPHMALPASRRAPSVPPAVAATPSGPRTRR